MGYAVGEVPSGVERITRLEMTWTVPDDGPRNFFAFYSPWFGMDPQDNLNLIQPVNPWSGRSRSWSMYTEYYQWRPTHNSNSRSYTVKAGQTLHGAIEYLASTDSYRLTQTIVETGVSSTQVVTAQNGKKYNLPYVVFEKTFPCENYPPNQVVTFRNIIAECDGKDCASDIKWTTAFVDDNCNMRAHVDKANLGYDSNEISITWDTSLSSKFDNYTTSELLHRNAGGWGKSFADAALLELEAIV